MIDADFDAYEVLVELIVKHHTAGPNWERHSYTQQRNLQATQELDRTIIVIPVCQSLGSRAKLDNPNGDSEHKEYDWTARNPMRLKNLPIANTSLAIALSTSRLELAARQANVRPRHCAINAVGYLTLLSHLTQDQHHLICLSYS